jgi:hypothetical protein
MKKVTSSLAALAAIAALGLAGCASSAPPQQVNPAPTPSPSSYAPTQEPLPTPHVTTPEEQYEADAKHRFFDVWHDAVGTGTFNDVQGHSRASDVCLRFIGAEGDAAEMTRQADKSLYYYVHHGLDVRVKVLRSAVDWKCPQFNSRVVTDQLQESYE